MIGKEYWTEVQPWVFACVVTKCDLRVSGTERKRIPYIE